jgi:hypothetical protein
LGWKFKQSLSNVYLKKTDLKIYIDNYNFFLKKG